MSNTQDENKSPFLTQKTASKSGSTCRKATSLIDMFDEEGRPLNRKARRMLKKIKRNM
jgi:hypothetical protein